MSSFLTIARVECCGHDGEPLIDEAIVPHTMMYEVCAVIWAILTSFAPEELLSF